MPHSRDFGGKRTRDEQIRDRTDLYPLRGVFLSVQILFQPRQQLHFPESLVRTPGRDVVGLPSQQLGYISPKRKDSDPSGYGSLFADRQPWRFLGGVRLVTAITYLDTRLSDKTASVEEILGSVPELVLSPGFSGQADFGRYLHEVQGLNRIQVGDPTTIFRDAREMVTRFFAQNRIDPSDIEYIASCSMRWVAPGQGHQP